MKSVWNEAGLISMITHPLLINEGDPKIDMPKKALQKRK